MIRLRIFITNLAGPWYIICLTGQEKMEHGESSNILHHKHNNNNNHNNHQHDRRLRDVSAPLIIDDNSDEETRSITKNASPFSFCCPCLFLCIDGALCCDWSTCEFWKVVPAFFASNAFSCSITILTVCHLIHHPFDSNMLNNHSNNSHNTNDAILSLGLWSYAVTTSSSNSHTDFINNNNNSATFNHKNPDIPMESCHSYEITDPITSLVFSDINFHLSRGLAVGTVCLGFGTMAALWIGMLQDSIRHGRGRHRGVTLRPNCCHWSRGVALALWVCAGLQVASFWLLQHDSVLCGHMDCPWGKGSSIVMAATLQYLLTGILMCWWPQSFDTYTHTSLANNEGDEDQDYDHPAEVAEIDDRGWGNLWNDLSSEQVELIQLSDNQPTIAPQPEKTVLSKSNTSNRIDPSPVSSSSSLWMADLESECHVISSTDIINPKPNIPKYARPKSTLPSQQSSRKILSESKPLELGTRNNLRDILNQDPSIPPSVPIRPKTPRSQQST
jgi:hypothetical protein